MKLRIFIGMLVVIAMGACVFKTKTATDKNVQSDHMRAGYQCPMDCEKGKVYDSAGTCPVCKMELEKK